MKLVKDQVYTVAAIRLLGWSDEDVAGTGNYQLRDYFESDGRYRGPDAIGVEPDVLVLTEGTPVVGGEPGTEDFDTGIIHYIDGNQAMVGWDSGVATRTPLVDLNPRGG